jgi:hypothetical protein
MDDDCLIREACEARAELARMLVVVADALNNMAAVSTALAAAAQRESNAMGAYVTELERTLARVHSAAELN